jgi:hypothetical protein
LVDVGLKLLRFAAEIDGLAHECALHADIRIVGAEFVRLCARETGGAVRISHAEALVDFRIEPEFSALPQPHTG